jgi:hypothetical protein
MVWVRMGLDGCIDCCFALDHRASIDFSGQIFFLRTHFLVSFLCRCGHHRTREIIE